MKQRQVHQTELSLEQGITARIGKDAHSNTALVRMADPTDVWIHVANQSGPHCVVEAALHQVTDDMLYECCVRMKPASLTGKRAEFTVTQISNVSPGKNPGEMFILDNSVCRTIFV
jgi:predicted ribosome quality control (RQC) complex YloA/Tae2 family protein